MRTYVHKNDVNVYSYKKKYPGVNQDIFNMCFKRLQLFDIRLLRFRFPFTGNFAESVPMLCDRSFRPSRVLIALGACSLAPGRHFWFVSFTRTHNNPFAET
jgi:hypothetical protein